MGGRETNGGAPTLDRMRQNQTNVWVRTEMVEAILHNDGTLPPDWKPGRKRSRSSGKLAWGWARAIVVPSQQQSNQDSPSSAILRRVKQKDPASPLRYQQQTSQEWAQEQGRITVTIHDAEFAPDHLQSATVTLDPNHFSAPLHMANAWWNTGGDPPDDLTVLTHLHEPAVVYCLQRRYQQDWIYTYTGKILLALNPFRPCPELYGPNVMKQYTANNVILGNEKQPPPHVYAVAQDAYSSMLRAMHVHSSGTTEDQSILVSGESGSGKTVTTKIIMQYLATLSRSHVQNHDRTATATNDDHIDIESQGTLSK